MIIEKDFEPQAHQGNRRPQLGMQLLSEAFPLSLIFALSAAISFANFSFFNSEAKASTSQNSSLAERFEQLLSFEHKIDGPNCWATALYALGLRTHLTYTDDSEFSAAIEKVCEPVGRRVLEKGDLGVIQSWDEANGTYSHVHTYIYFGGGSALSKFDYRPSSQIDVFPIYKASLPYMKDMPSPCQDWRENQTPNPKLCPSFRRNLRCHMNKNLRAGLDPIMVEKFERLESEFEKAVKNPTWDISTLEENRYLERLDEFTSLLDTPGWRPLITSLSYQYTSLSQSIPRKERKKREAKPSILSLDLNPSQSEP